MAFQFATYKESLNFFKNVSYKTSEYYLHGKAFGAPMKKVPTQKICTIALEGLVHEQKELENYQAVSIVKKEAIERFSPNNIDNRQFWVDCREAFPLISICGAESKNIKQVNQRNLEMTEAIGALPFVKELIANSKEKLSVLEIGYGYGNVFFELNDICNYCGIDYIKPKSLKKYKNLVEIHESGIPDFLLNIDLFDVVYSVNVLQHCSQRDRFIYFKQASEALKSGGYLVFSLFLMTKENKNDSCWGFIDEKGRGYTQFFNQLTECDWDYELYHVLSSLGFEPVKSGILKNFYVGIVRKK